MSRVYRIISPTQFLCKLGEMSILLHIAKAFRNVAMTMSYFFKEKKVAIIPQNTEIIFPILEVQKYS